jgi:hypothetical protein
MRDFHLAVDINYESLTAEGGHAVALVTIGIAGTRETVTISEHWELADNKALSLWWHSSSRRGCSKAWALRTGSRASSSQLDPACATSPSC